MAYKRNIEIFEEAYTKKDNKSVLSYVSRDGKKRYISGSGNPDGGGDMPSGGGMTETTWQELKDKRDAGELTPGSLYRITDYNCTTTQENTRSAGHQFDIVLLALSANKLAEEGWAMMNESNVYDVTFAGEVTKKCYLYKYTDTDCYIIDVETKLGVDVALAEIQINEADKTIFTGNYISTELETPNLPYNYFQNSNLSAWKVWYCLDNDTARFAWADGGTPAMIEFTYDGTEVTAKRNTEFDRDYNGESYFAWSEDGYDTLEYAYFTKDASPATHSTLYYYADNKMKLLGAQTSNYQPPQYNGRGVIYRLIDEFNNDIKYDFKNIQFVRDITDGQYDEEGDTTWCYTLNIWYQDMCQDASIVGNTLPNDEGYITGVYDNIFGSAIAYDLELEGVNTFAFVLGNNVVLSFDDSGYFGIYSNTIGNNFYSNTIGSSFYSNIIGNCFGSNKIGNYFTYNMIGNGFQNKTISDATSSKNYGNNGVELATKDDLN